MLTPDQTSALVSKALRQLVPRVQTEASGRAATAVPGSARVEIVGDAVAVSLQVRLAPASSRGEPEVLTLTETAALGDPDATDPPIVDAVALAAAAIGELQRQVDEAARATAAATETATSALELAAAADSSAAIATGQAALAEGQAATAASKAEQGEATATAAAHAAAAAQVVAGQADGRAVAAVDAAAAAAAVADAASRTAEQALALAQSALDQLRLLTGP